MRAELGACRICHSSMGRDVCKHESAAAGFFGVVKQAGTGPGLHLLGISARAGCGP